MTEQQFNQRYLITPTQVFDSQSIILISLLSISIILFIAGIKFKRLRLFVPFAMLWVKHKGTKDKIISTSFFLAELIAIVWILTLNPDFVQAYSQYVPVLSASLTYISIWLVFYIPILLLNLIYMGVKKIWD